MEINDSQSQKLSQENKNLSKELNVLTKHKKNLELIIENITSTRAFKLWQQLNKLKSIKTLAKLIESKIKNELSYLKLKLNLNNTSIGSDVEDSIASTPLPLVLSKNYSVSVVICTKNSPDSFETTLRLYKNQIGVKVKIIIVDSGSEDETLSMAKKYDCEIYKIKPEDFKHGKTRNLAISKSKSEYIVNTVTDAIPGSNDLLYKTIHFLNKTKASAVSVRQIPYNDADYFAQWILFNHSKYLFPNKKNDVLIERPKNFENMNPIGQRRYCVLDDVFTLHKASVIQKELYSKTIEYAEDLEYSKRLLIKNHKIAFMNSLGIIHSHNRPAEYFLKRYFVDTIGVYQIMNTCPSNYPLIENMIQESNPKKINNIINNVFISYFFRKKYLQKDLYSDFDKLTSQEKFLKIKIKDADFIYVKELQEKLPNSLIINKEIIKRFDEGLNYLRYEFNNYLLKITDNKSLQKKAKEEIYDKLLCMNLGICLGELFIRLNNKKLLNNKLKLVQKLLFYSV